MCGIGVTIITTATTTTTTDDYDDASSSSSSTDTEQESSSNAAAAADVMTEFLQRRGPDYYNVVHLSSVSSPTTLTIHVQASVLHMRGTTMTVQPVRLNLRYGGTTTSDDGNDDDETSEAKEERTTTAAALLMWNGEVYQMLLQDQNDYHDVEGGTTSTTLDDPNRPSSSFSDTRLVATMLERTVVALSRQQQGQQKEDDHDKVTTAHSVVLHRAIVATMNSVTNGEFAFCVVSDDHVFYGRDVLGRRSLLVSAPSSSSTNNNNNSDNDDDDGTTRTKDCCCCWQLSSVATPPSDDSTGIMWTEVLPGYVFCYHIASSTTTYLSLVRPKVTTNNGTSLDDGTKVTSPPLPGHVDVSESMWLASLRLQGLLTESVRRRCYGVIPSFGVRAAEPTTTMPSRRSIGIMFSGGLDSAVLAALTAHVVSSSIANDDDATIVPIDLLNVSFVGNGNNDDDDRGHSTNCTTGRNAAADRTAALQSYQDLQRAYPRQTFRLVCIEVNNWDDVLQQQEERIQQLMFPKHTTMDLNIATALWFAAKGEGRVLVNDTTSNDCNAPNVSEQDDDYTWQPFTSTCRILLMGMGADEQMAGYGRHRKCFERHGTEGLRKELDMDMSRLWERNLGRDDRLVSDHGKEARFPYLDPTVVDFLASLPLEDVCDFTKEPGIGDKQILRLVAQRLGLETAAGLVKRAIQFGSRIAHVSDKRRFGSRRKATGQSRVRGPAPVNSIDVNNK